jgi:hypothetical protein
MSCLFVCRKTNNYVLSICGDDKCDWFISCEKFCNCTFVAAHFGPFSNAEIGAMMNVTGERIRQIEMRTIEKLKVMKENGLLPKIELSSIYQETEY